jgi:hypothetical protein
MRRVVAVRGAVILLLTGNFSLFSLVEFLCCSPGGQLKALGNSIFPATHDQEKNMPKLRIPAEQFQGN